MDTMFKIKHFAHKTLLTLLGPADLDEHNDPRLILQRAYDERFAPTPTAEVDEVGHVAQVAAVPQLSADRDAAAPVLAAQDQRAVA